MSIIKIKQRHPLVRNGTDRFARLIAALNPSAIRLDDRSLQDLMVTAHRYAQQLSYFDKNNKHDGDWTCFWEVETLTYLAVLAAYDTDELRKTYDDTDYALYQALEQYNPAKKKKNPASDLRRQLVGHLFQMAKGLEEMYLKLVQIKHPLQTLLLNFIKRDNQCDFEELQGALQQLVALHKGADDHLNHDQYAIFFVKDNRWGIRNRKEYDQIKPDPNLTREKLRELFLTFYNTYLVLKDRAQQAFDAELALMEKPEEEAFRVVEPHVALFIAFLRLFHYAQDSLNELTKKQLDYYYEHILCLQRRPARPDHVYLIFTLAKNFQTELIEAGTLLVGGKDKNGLPVYYQTLQDWVVSQAQVAEVKNFFLGRKFSFNYDSFSPLIINKKTILAADFLPNGNTPQRIFADKYELNEAEVGFVIASPQLGLQEGKRGAHIFIDHRPPLYESGGTEFGFSVDLLDLFVSTKDGWKQIPSDTSAIVNDTQFADLASFDLSVNYLNQASFRVEHNLNAGELRIQFYLPPDFPALEPMAENAMTKWPAVKIALKKEALDKINNNYENLLNSFDPDSNNYKSVFRISVRVEDISKSLILKTDLGEFDGTQQIQPFGPLAPKGAKFYLGNQEALLKKIQTVRVHFDWVGAADINYAQYPASGVLYAGSPAYTNPSGSIDVDFLENNTFENSSMKGATWDENIWTGTTMKGALSYSFLPQLKRGDPNYHFTTYDLAARRGFFRFTFNGDFYHNEYPQILAIEALKGTSGKIPLPPYTPTFNTIKLDYVSVGQRMEADIDEFFYIHPFSGYEKRAAAYKSTDPTDDIAPAKNPISLFPDYVNVVSNKFAVDGHLFIGLSQLIPGSSISLFFQMLAGSELMPDNDPPAIHWHYLTAGNTWAPLPVTNILLDTTRGLTRSGMIQMAIPAGISSEGNTLLNPELYWLRAVALEETNQSAAALPSLLDLRTQVLEAQLQLEEGLQPIHLENGQPAGSVSKLAISRSTVKKIEQPYPTFGGRIAETEGLDFYRRISERLRHRCRAITVWDYEHLALDQFEEIATAKCISHTEYKVPVASELAPGFVTLAVIPLLSKRTGVARAQPRFPKGDLDDIRDYLNRQANLFLNQPVLDTQGDPISDHKYLQVVNPQYETIQIKVQVRFRPGIDEAFYKIRLSDDLVNFLSPWLTDDQAPPVFGRVLRRSKILEFIEKLSYIDYIHSFQLELNGFAVVKESIYPSAAHGILSSASSHSVTSA